LIIPIISIGLLLVILERLIPDQKLPVVKGWWTRVVIVNFFQLCIVLASMFTIDQWFQQWQMFQINIISPQVNGFISYFAITFIFYWWHRWRHDINALWLHLHQVHHSPQRIETITSFYKHPLEIITNSVIIGSINFMLLGMSVEAAAWSLFYASLGEYFYHMNIKTPAWVGYFFQRPEMHRIHHQRGKHYQNFSDFPFWDMLFGTFNNPKTYQGPCGYQPQREIKLLDMLLFKNVNNPYRGKDKA
jgi:sterol desaturase/sphingolipid hydroxylase (fatty acid hydroxylase superfamily)